VLNLFKFFQLEKARGRPFYSPDNLIKRTCKAAGISYSSVYRVINGTRLPACNGQNRQEFSFFRSVGLRRTFTVYNSIHRTVRYASSLACSFNQIIWDYHQEMNGPIFLNWFENQLIPALKSPSVIVLDNASYHNIKTEETVVPNFNQRKAVLQDDYQRAKLSTFFLFLKGSLGHQNHQLVTTFSQ
jgi:hypothetical protein